MGMPVPAADPDALTRMKREQMYEKQHGEHAALLKSPLKIFKTGPGVAAAAHSGEPNLSPPDEAVSATDVLKQGAPGPTFEVGARPALATGDASGSGEVDTSSPVEAVASDASNGAPVTGAAVEIISAPTSSSDTSAPSSAAPAAPETSPAVAPVPAAPMSANVGVPAPAPSAASPSAIVTTSGNGTVVAGGSTPAQSGAPQVAQGATGNSTTPTGPQTAAKANSKTESTSKKKKGVHKLIPW
jgi:hypothetical protein